jgi:UDP-N-acetyl-2-amino-2-deoxyglucuronate dehydrogenase
VTGVQTCALPISEPETDGRSGLKSLELLVAMYRSAKDGIKVSLPLES